MTLAGHSVWVIGAGYLGSALADTCRAAGARVLTIDPAAVANLRGSAADAALLRHAMERLVPDMVFCCTATHGGSPEEYERAYLLPAENLGRLLRGTRVVFCSTTSLYAGQGGAVVTEDTPPRAESDRTRVLLRAEAVILERGGVVARLAPLYGPGRCELVRRFMLAMPQLPGAPERRMNYLHRDDAVSALLMLATQPWLEHGLYNVSSESFTKQTIYELLKATFHIEPEPESSAPSVRGVSDMRVDCTRLQRLGWKPQKNMLTFAREWNA